MNMEAKDFRIGNFVNHKNDFYEILEISQEWVQLNNSQLNTELKEIKPIPITEEWLIKFGFTKNYNVLWISMANIKAELHAEIYPRGMVFIIRSDTSELILDPIKYVHQLQNLYFALTGTELTTI